MPRLSIDFGDGRRLEGTITGNSVHYVLDSRGRLVDALPGLYGPGLFLDRLQAAEEEARGLAQIDDSDFGRVRAGFDAGRLAAITAQLASETVGDSDASAVPVTAGEPPTASEAATRATTSSAIEIPVLTAVSVGDRTPSSPVSTGRRLPPAMGTTGD